MTHRSTLPSASTFMSALQVYENLAEVSRLSTGNHRLDQLIGGIEASTFYLFYGSDKEKVPDRLLYRLMVETIKQSTGHVVYMLCGNYRRDRTTFDSELLLELLEGSCLNLDDSLRRIHIIGVFSEGQLMNAPHLVEDIIKQVGDVRLLAVQQISKLFYSEFTVGIEDRIEFTGVVSRLKELCSVHGISMVATCETKKRRSLSPEPMGGSFLRHVANVLVYLREMSVEEVSAQLVKHFDKIRIGKRISLVGEEVETLGRVTRDSMRGKLQDSIRHLRGGYREALKDILMQAAFDDIWEDWDQEQGAMLFAQVVSAFDLLNLTGILGNRKEINALHERVQALERRNEN